MGASGESSPKRLRRYFTEVASGPQIGGAAVLGKLCDLASSCIDGNNSAQDAVAFGLSAIFGYHAEDRDDRAVTGDDTYLLVAAGLDDLSEAVKFVEEGGSAEQAIRIIAALAQLTPGRLYGRD
jgi:hypothetical protein